MREFTGDEISRAQGYFERQHFPIEKFEVDGRMLEYFVLPQSSNPALLDFALRMTRTNPEGQVEGIFGVSDSVPPHLRPWWARHEYEEFVKIGMATKDRCAEAERRVLGSDTSRYRRRISPKTNHFF
jgi:hypothetical protein